MARTNAAYDDSKYDLDKYRHLSIDGAGNENITKSHEYITIKRRNAERGNTVKIIVLAFAALVLLFCVVYGKVQISDMYSKINSQKSELAVMESENARLKAEIEAYTSLRNIEEYAEDIGLKKLDKAQIWYVDIQNDDVVKIPETEDDFIIQIKKKFMAFLDNFECFIK